MVKSERCLRYEKDTFICIALYFHVCFCSRSQPYDFIKDISDPSQIQIQIVCLESGMDQYDFPYNEDNSTVINVIEKK